MGIGGVAVGAFGIAGCNSSGPRRDGAPSTNPSSGGDVGQDYSPPEEVRSADGRLEVTLVAAATMVPWGSGSRYALTYNGGIPGPTLRVRPGDTLTLTLRNDLDTPTNLHTHGLHISPSGRSDNVFVMIEPGAAYTYEYVLPEDHPSGTFWYHPHHHGVVAAQISGGLAGAIVVEDELDDDPAFRSATERILVLSDPQVGTDASVLDVSAAQQMLGREGDVVLTNGQVRPRGVAKIGTTELWRIVNASASKYYLLSSDAASMHQVASDQGRLAAPIHVPQVLVAPGQRVEVMVPLVVAGTVTLSTAAVDRGGMGMGGGMGGASSAIAADLLVIDVTGPATAVGPLPASLRALDDLAAFTVDRRRSFTLGAMGMGRGAFVINGKSFDGARVDTTVAIDTIEEWTITNESMMDHPFHLHVWPFRVVSRTDGADPDPGWRDTVNVAAGHSVVIRVVFHDFDGTAVYHCHILDHEDLGMMGVISVV